MKAPIKRYEVELVGLGLKRAELQFSAGNIEEANIIVGKYIDGAVRGPDGYGASAQMLGKVSFPEDRKKDIIVTYIREVAQP